MGRRIKRVNEQLKREIAEILIGEVRDPRVGPATVTGVSTDADLTLARVFVQVMGDDAEREATLKGLQGAAPFIRAALGQRIVLRRIPELRFEADRSLEHAMRIEALLDEAGASGERDAERDAAETDPDGTGDRAE